jgi:hypothetical protein
MFEWRRLTLIHLDIHGAPPYIVLTGLLEDDSLVFRASAGLLAGKINECARRGNNGAFIADSIFVKLGYRRVALELNSVHVETCLREVLEVMADDYSTTDQ